MIILVTGGARSGKSSYAEGLLKGLPQKVYVATAPVCDEEFRERVRRHQAARAADNWQTVEEELELARVLRESSEAQGVLVDCLTLWINNLIYHKKIRTEEDMIREANALLDAASACKGTVVFVINEVGLGIVPDNPVSRLFRDCSGRCAQLAAARAAQVVLTVCGLPVMVKS